MEPKIRKVLGRKLYVLLFPVGEKTIGESGIIVSPQAHSETSRVGVVKAVGPKCDPDIKVGDAILVAYHAGVVLDSVGPWLAKDDTYRIMDEAEVLAILD